MTPVIARIQRANYGCNFRAYGLREVPALIDPFIGVDHAWMSAPTFPPHPHSGFSAISYVFLDSETGISNRDSIGTDNLIQPGGLHWVAAGCGVIHEEVPAEVNKTVHSLQIFVNLAEEHQSLPPFALSLEPQDVPTVLLPGAKVRVPVGSFSGTCSLLGPPTEVTMLDISLEGDAELSIPTPAGECTFIMPIFGAVAVNGQKFDLEDLRLPVFQAAEKPHVLKLQALNGAAKAMLFSAPPFTTLQPGRQGVS